MVVVCVGVCVMLVLEMNEFHTILMDPPWNETGGGKIKRGADRHYPLVKTPDMPRVILSAPVWRPAVNSHLYMWATASHLPDALWLMAACGFKYKTHAVWVKPYMGLGQYFRMRHELLLFGVRGRGFACKTQSRALQSVVEAARGAHSAKPNEAIQLIQARSMGPYLEMFARAPRDGWTVWGNEVD
jgi:N6-adenosine-specific RNA methylase IME4